MSTEHERLQQHIAELLTMLGLDLSDKHFRETPERMVRWYKEWFDYEDPKQITTFNEVSSDIMVAVTHIDYYSLCPHHLLPWSFTAHVGYIGHDQIVGLSKIPRIVFETAHAAITQEGLTNNIASRMMSEVGAQGVAVMTTNAVHTCMTMRGAKARGSKTGMSVRRGVFLGNPYAWNEFKEIIKINGA